MATSQTRIGARSCLVALGQANQMTLNGTKCGGPAGPVAPGDQWEVSDGGFEVTFTGCVDYQVAGDRLARRPRGPARRVRQLTDMSPPQRICRTRPTDPDSVSAVRTSTSA